MPTGSHTLTVACSSGLANRLRVLLSGAELATATRREFLMIWPPTEACGATFDRLFSSPWHVVDSDPVAGRRFTSFGAMRTPRAPDLLRSPDHDLAVSHVGSFFVPAEHLRHAVRAAAAARLIERLVPAAPLQRRVDAFVEARFRPSMIGVHLRRGDFVRRQPDVVANTASAIAAVARRLQHDPSAGILLCTDDGGPDQVTGQFSREGVREQFVARFGDRVVWTDARSLDRRDPIGVEDAVVDLWLLRRTHYVVGTTGSSFSELAVLGRTADAVFCGEPTERYRRLERWARATRVDAFLRALPLSSRLGPDATLPALWSFYASLPGAAVRRFRRAGRGK